MVPPLTPDDRELIQQLLDDVELLEAQFSAGIERPATARGIFAPILRRWIVEALFFQAQKLILPAQATFPIFSNDQAVELCNKGFYEHWMGMIVFSGVGMSTSRMAPRYLGPDGRPAMHLSEGVLGPPAPEKASKFFKQRMFFWKGHFYTRADMIKIHANSLGGVHFDFRTAMQEPHIHEIKNYVGFEVNGANHQILVGEEIQGARADSARRKSVYDATELITIDTARIFVDGIRSSQQPFLSLLA